MSQSDIPQLPQFDDLENLLDTERKTIIQVNGFSGEELDYVRSVEDARTILNFIRNIQTLLHALFNQYPSLIFLFDKEFLSAQEFFQRSYILDLCFLDDCLIPEKEVFFFGQDGGLSQDVLNLHIHHFTHWIEDKKGKHESTQVNLRENFSFHIKSKELDCQCITCLADYRTKLREEIFEECLVFIEKGRGNIAESLESDDFNTISCFFSDMQKSIEKTFRKVRYRLRRSTLNRLEVQVKNKIKEIFTYPSELALAQEKKLEPFLRHFLYEEGINEDLIGDGEFKKFFNQLSSNIWRNERYLIREFKKLVKSVMVLKKKDISGKILQEYIGEFWVHSQARTIKRKIVYHMGPTNSGKTYHAIEKLASIEKGCYLAPLRLLAAELFDTLNNKGVVTTLLTGEEVIEKEEATHYSSTIEMARLQEYFDCCVIDEIQMITDRQRGWAWTRALVNIFAEEVHICGDPSALELVQKIVKLCGDELEIVNYERMTKLQVEKKSIILGDLKRSDALIVFSRRNALRYKRDLERLGFKVSIVYGRLSPEVRREQARKFDVQETDIMVSTDAIAMGMNLPIRRIVFSTLSKYIDSQEHPITESEIKQIAGRAGRFQRFATGFVTCLTKCEAGLEQIEEALHCELEQQTKCMVGPDLDIYNQVNKALEDHGLTSLKLSEFLRLFNTMDFQKPFYCVELKEMIELAEMVEDADSEAKLKPSEVFGFACAPVNLGLLDHVQYYIWILKHYVTERPIHNEAIDSQSSDIDYLETSIKCVELYQWLSRHFNNKHFVYSEVELLTNKGEAIDKLNTLLSDKIVPTCASCGVKMKDNSKFNICDQCFKERRFSRGRKKNKAFGARKKNREGTGEKNRSSKRPIGRGKKRTRKRRST